MTRERYPERRFTGVAECIGVLDQARRGGMVVPIEGDLFQTHRPASLAWASGNRPELYSCSSGPQMIRMGGRVADGIQLSDFTVAELPESVANLREGAANRDDGVAPRVGNFWARHIKAHPEGSHREARRELIWRRSLAARYRDDLARFCHDDAEVDLVVNSYMSFMGAFFSGSGVIDGVPEDLVNRLIAGMSSAGGLDAIEGEIARFRSMADAGLTELALRLGDDPMDALELVGQHVVPALG